MDSAAGDLLTISRTHLETVGNLSIEKLTQLATGPAPTQTNGLASDFSAAFVTPPLNQVAQLAADLPFVREQLSGAADLWSLRVVRGPGAALGLQMGPPLFSVRGADFSAPLGLSATFADPFDPSWDLVTRFYAERLHPVETGGTGSPQKFHDVISVMQSLAGPNQTISSPLPLLSELSINGTRVTDGGVVQWNGASSLTFRATLPPNADGFEISFLKVSELEATEVLHLTALGAEITIPANDIVIGEPYVLLGTLAFNAEGTHAVSQAVWGPVTLRAP